MSDNTDQHLPTPEFRASLEREVIRAFRKESKLPSSMTKRTRLRTAATLALGLALGVGGAVATAQVQQGRQKSELVQSAGAEWQLLTLRWYMAETKMNEIKRAVDAGTRSRKDLKDAELEFRVVETAVQKFNLRQEELRATGAVARDELWAPLVGKRDFVTERLNADASLASSQLEISEENVQASRQRTAAGLSRMDDAEELEIELTQRQRERDFEFVGKKLAMRKEFLAGTLDKSSIPTKLQLLNLDNELAHTLVKIKIATMRATRAKEKLAVGAATEIDVKRAELLVLEESSDLVRLKQLFDSLTTAQTRKKKP